MFGKQGELCPQYKSAFWGWYENSLIEINPGIKKIRRAWLIGFNRVE